MRIAHTLHDIGTRPGSYLYANLSVKDCLEKVINCVPDANFSQNFRPRLILQTDRIAVFTVDFNGIALLKGDIQYLSWNIIYR